MLNPYKLCLPFFYNFHFLKSFSQTHIKREKNFCSFCSGTRKKGNFIKKLFITSAGKKIQNRNEMKGSSSMNSLHPTTKM